MTTAVEQEIRPLVSTNKNYGLYDDDYIPVDEDSRQILKSRRMKKYLGVVLILVATASVALSQRQQPHQGLHSAAATADHLFAGLLAEDQQAFYFPTTLGSKQRILRAASNTWNGAAIGEYYRAKGMAMADYYRSKFDPTYKAPAEDTTTADESAADSDAANTAEDDASPWTYDWKADMDRGMALGQHYKAIGDAIDAHYRRAFDPTYTAADGSNGRRLKSKDQKKKDQKKKELAFDMANENDATGWYDWQADRDRGMVIGMHYKQLGEQIADHYNQEFNPMYDVNKKAYSTDKNWANLWKDYRQRGQEISNYYKAKGAAIDKFYQGKDMASQIVDDGNPAAKEATANIWNADWKKDRQDAMDIHTEMMKKGLAIGE